MRWKVCWTPVCKERISGKQSYIFNNYRANAAEEMKYHTICCYAEEPMPPWIRLTPPNITIGKPQSHLPALLPWKPMHAYSIWSMKRISGTSLLYQAEGKHDKGQYTKQYQYRDTGKRIQPTQITEWIIPAASATAAKGTMDAGNRYSSAEYRIHRIFFYQREKRSDCCGKPVTVQRSRSKWTTGERNPAKE